MRRHLAYLKAVLRHKWFVLLEGRKLKVPLWRLILHDWDKFLPSMWMAYSTTFYAANGKKQYVPNDAFYRAWLGHQNRNRHHWQYWILHNDDIGPDALEMPDVDRREMLADWRGAGRAYDPNWTPRSTVEWYKEHYLKMWLHSNTRDWIDAQLYVYSWRYGFVD